MGDEVTKNPFVVMYKELKNGKRRKVGFTEIAIDEQEPEFETQIVVDFNFNCNDVFCAEVYYARDDEGSYDSEFELDTTNEVFVGKKSFTLHDIISKTTNLMRYELTS